MRCFIAVEIPEKIKDRLEKIQVDLRRAGVRATRVKRKAIHLTLIFFAQINEKETEKISQILKNQENQSLIELKLASLGAFPNLDFPKIIWVGLEGETEKLITINSQIRAELQKEKIPFDPKPFIPHLTLGRLRRIRQRKQVSKILKQFSLKEKPEFKVSQIALIKSKITPKGPFYTELEKVNVS